MKKKHLRIIDNITKSVVSFLFGAIFTFLLMLGWSFKVGLGWYNDAQIKEMVQVYEWFQEHDSLHLFYDEEDNPILEPAFERELLLSEEI